MLFYRIRALWGLQLLCITTLYFAAPCHAAPQLQEHRAVCGAYSYTLPTGFKAVDMPQPHADSVYLYAEPDLSPPDNSVTCIQHRSSGPADSILETLDVLAPHYDADMRMRIVRHNDQIRPDVRAYYIEYLHDGHAGIPWSRFLLEMDTRGTGEHTIVYLYEASPYHPDPKAGPDAPPVPISRYELEQRATDLIRSIHKDR